MIRKFLFIALIIYSLSISLLYMHLKNSYKVTLFPAATWADRAGRSTAEVHYSKGINKKVAYKKVSEDILVHSNMMENIESRCWLAFSESYKHRMAKLSEDPNSISEEFSTQKVRE